MRFIQVQGHSWCKGNIPPTSEHILMLFCTYCEDILKLSYTTIKMYLCGVRFFFMRNWGFSPLEKGNGQTFTCLQAILNAIKKKQTNNIKRVRQPITANILANMCKVLTQGLFSYYNNVMLKAACLVAFFGFMRCGELTCMNKFDEKINLCYEDVRLIDGCIFVNLKKSKTDPFRQGVSIQIHKNGSKICPIAAILHYLEVRENKFAQSNLSTKAFFVTETGESLSRTFFIQHVKMILHNLGQNSDSFNGHSFRIGAATTAQSVRLEPHLIQTLGRWSSDCYRTYIHTSADVIRDAQNQLASIV